MQHCLSTWPILLLYHCRVWSKHTMVSWCNSSNSWSPMGWSHFTHVSCSYGSTIGYISWSCGELFCSNAHTEGYLFCMSTIDINPGLFLTSKGTVKELRTKITYLVLTIEHFYNFIQIIK